MPGSIRSDPVQPNQKQARQAFVHSSFAMAFVAGLAGVASQPAQAQVSYVTPGSTYVQNFNTLPLTPENVSLGNSPTGWVDNSTSPGANQFSIQGWYLLHPLTLAEGGANGNQRVRIGAGTATTGAFMSYGATGSSDRALGSLASNTLTPAGGEVYFGLRLSNDSGQALDSFTLSYDGEQWRDGGSTTPNAQSLSFGWSVGATGLTNGTFTSEANLSYSSPIFLHPGAGTAVDGNSTGRVAVAFTVTGINWANGQDLWLRWSDVNNTGTDHGLAIDNLTFSAIPVVPEPSTWALLGLGTLVMFGCRRLRKS